MDIGDILLIVFAIIGTIISAVAKSAKKKAEVAQDDQSAYDSWLQEEEYESNERQMRDQEQGRGAIPPQQDRELHALEAPAREYWSYDQQVIAEPVSCHQVNDTNRPRRNMNDSKDGVYSIKEAEKEGEHFDGLNDVKLKDIIIYSELLKPKFKEY